MSAGRKTKQELEDELKKLQRRIEKLQKTIAEAQTKTKNLQARQPRKEIKADIEFIGDFDLIRAKAVNISASGICFKTSANLPFEMRYQHNGQTISRRAHLIWLRHEKKNGYNFGLKFVNKKKYPQF
jgi:TolA-binding protein